MKRGPESSSSEERNKNERRLRKAAPKSGRLTKCRQTSPFQLHLHLKYSKSQTVDMYVQYVVKHLEERNILRGILQRIKVQGHGFATFVVVDSPGSALPS